MSPPPQDFLDVSWLLPSPPSTSKSIWLFKGREWNLIRNLSKSSPKNIIFCHIAGKRILSIHMNLTPIFNRLKGEATCFLLEDILSVVWYLVKVSGNQVHKGTCSEHSNVILSPQKSQCVLLRHSQPLSTVQLRKAGIAPPNACCTCHGTTYTVWGYNSLMWWKVNTILSFSPLLLCVRPFHGTC